MTAREVRIKWHGEFNEKVNDRTELMIMENYADEYCRVMIGELKREICTEIRMLGNQLSSIGEQRFIIKIEKNEI